MDKDNDEYLREEEGYMGKVQKRGSPHPSCPPPSGDVIAQIAGRIFSTQVAKLELWKSDEVDLYRLASTCVDIATDLYEQSREAALSLEAEIDDGVDDDGETDDSEEE